MLLRVHAKLGIDRKTKRRPRGGLGVTEGDRDASAGREARLVVEGVRVVGARFHSVLGEVSQHEPAVAVNAHVDRAILSVVAEAIKLADSAPGWYVTEERLEDGCVILRPET